jgi:GWxTD domain-containing protein
MHHLRIRLVVLAVAAGTACGQWRRVGSEPSPTPDAILPGMFDLASVYRHMGFLAQGPPVAFVATVRFLAGPQPDSTLAVFAGSLANNTLSFRRTDTGFEAIYQVEARFEIAGGSRVIASTERVRVAAYPETQRADESVIFQRTLLVPPGSARMQVTFRDVNTGGYSRDSANLSVPRYADGRAVSSMVPLHQGAERTTRTVVPSFVVNPRATVPFGSDTLRVYLEGYGYDDGTEIQFRAVDDSGTEVWTAGTRLHGTPALASTLLFAPPGTLPVGELRVEAVVGGGDTVRAPVLVTLSDLWMIANLDDVIKVLRYFGHDDRLRALRAAPPADRPQLWRDFWRETDPNPNTPENEALISYFARVQQANQRFREGSDAGWITDRGEVFINLGAPDEVYDNSAGFQGTRRIRWVFTVHRLAVDFVDESGFGRFRLTPSSRADYQIVLARVRR